MPPRRAVELRVGGQTYRVVASDEDPHVQHLAELVDRKFGEVVPAGLVRSMTPHQAMFLTAMALAAEVEELQVRAERLEGERDRSLHLATRAKEAVGRLLQRVDHALAPVSDTAPRASRTTEDGRAGSPKAPASAREDSDDSPDYLASLPDDVRQSSPRVGPPDRSSPEEPILIDLGDPSGAVPLRPRSPSPARPPRSAGAPRPPAPAERPAVASSLPFEQDNDATVPRAPRAGLRLVRRSTSPDDDTR